MPQNSVNCAVAYLHVFTIALCSFSPKFGGAFAQEGEAIVIRTEWGFKAPGIVGEKHLIERALEVDKVTPVFLLVQNGSSIPLMINSSDFGSLPGSKVLFSKAPILPGNIEVVEMQLMPASLAMRKSAARLPLFFDTSAGKIQVSLDVTFSNVSNFQLPTNLVHVNENGDQLGSIPLVVSTDVKLENLQFRLNESSSGNGSSPGIVAKARMVNGSPCVALHVERERIVPGRFYDLEIVRGGKVVGTTKLVSKYADSVSVSPEKLTLFREIAPNERDKYFLRGFFLLVSRDISAEYAAEYICDVNKDVVFETELIKISEGIVRVEVRCEFGLLEEMTADERNACKLVVRQANQSPRVFARPLYGQSGDFDP